MAAAFGLVKELECGIVNFLDADLQETKGLAAPFSQARGARRFFGDCKRGFDKVGAAQIRVGGGK